MAIDMNTRAISERQGGNDVRRIPGGVGILGCNSGGIVIRFFASLDVSPRCARSLLSASPFELKRDPRHCSGRFLYRSTSSPVS
jgi:hypothetical protein